MLVSRVETEKIERPVGLGPNEEPGLGAPFASSRPHSILALFLSLLALHFSCCCLPPTPCHTPLLFFQYIGSSSQPTTNIFFFFFFFFGGSSFGSSAFGWLTDQTMSDPCVDNTYRSSNGLISSVTATTNLNGLMIGASSHAFVSTGRVGPLSCFSEMRTAAYVPVRFFSRAKTGGRWRVVTC
jgi:hypothetical protein